MTTLQLAGIFAKRHIHRRRSYGTRELLRGRGGMPRSFVAQVAAAPFAAET